MLKVVSLSEQQNQQKQNKKRKRNSTENWFDSNERFYLLKKFGLEERSIFSSFSGDSFEIAQRFIDINRVVQTSTQKNFIPNLHWFEPVCTFLLPGLSRWSVFIRHQQDGKKMVYWLRLFRTFHIHCRYFLRTKKRRVDATLDEFDIIPPLRKIVKNYQ